MTKRKFVALLPELACTFLYIATAVQPAGANDFSQIAFAPTLTPTSNSSGSSNNLNE